MGIHNQFAGFFETMSFSLISYQRIKEILDARPQVQEAKEAKEAVLENCSVELKNVTFGYRLGEAVIRNLSFKIEQDKHIALAGPSGCGKTTLLNLILRLYDPWEGDILIGGYNIKDLQLKSLRENFGIALQEPFLWNDSIKNNITYARPRASEEEVKEVARICLIDRFVDSLPDRYETIIGEDACKLSEGQKQKIAIARALIKKPKILILDEAMSSMDSASEEQIVRNIKEAYKDITIISVSHRLSTVMACDLVYFFKKPDEMVVDKPQHLLEQDEDFQNLFATQARQEVDLKWDM
jgi:ABC-type multidrug transport system fused ATPase/permease subunit